MVPKQDAYLKIPSPMVKLSGDLWYEKGIELWMKREDLIHPQISGNKWRKLEFNIEQMRKEGKSGILTFGGAYSNHIYATAAAGQLMDFKTIGVIRGEETLPLNETLAFVKSAGMTLEYVSRSRYREKASLMAEYGEKYPDFYLLPEGGSNSYALPGCAKVMDEIKTELGFSPDYVCLACGTGGTMAGLISAGVMETTVLGFAVLKGSFHGAEIKKLLAFNEKEGEPEWEVFNHYHFGGYAKSKPELLEFIQDFYTQHQIQLECIYTGKMMYGVMDLIEKDFFPKGSRIVVIHTGGVR